MACLLKSLQLLLAGFALAPMVTLANDSAGAASGPGKLLQCWIDDAGRRVCGDQVPPSDARRKRELYDGRGVIKGVVPAQKSPEEVAAEEQARRDAEARVARDRFLLQTYRAPEDIDRARDERLSTLDGRLELARKNLIESSAVLEDLRKRVADPNDAKAAARLHDQIAIFEKAQADNQAAIGSMEAERARTVADFGQQAGRFRELRNGGSAKE